MYDLNELVFVFPHFKEFGGKGESIYDHVQDGISYSDKVLTYLKIFHPILASGLIYEHPFIPGKRKSGKCYMSDGRYVWDGDTFEYVTNYGLALPQDFVEHIMSAEGTRFLESCAIVETFSQAMELYRKDKDRAIIIRDYLTEQADA